MEEILERQLLIRGRALAIFSTIEKALADRMRPRAPMLCRPAPMHILFRKETELNHAGCVLRVGRCTKAYPGSGPC